MTRVLLLFWIASAFIIIYEQKIVRTIIYLGIFSLISSLCFLLFAAPDVAMAEAVVSALSTIIYIVTFEKYYSLADLSAVTKRGISFKNHILPLIFSVLLFVLFIRFIPDTGSNPYLKNQYISMFSNDVGGENTVTAIYLGYRMYDTLFEALMLLVSIVAVIHLSLYQDILVLSGKRRDINSSDITTFTIRIISPVLVLYGAYLIMNGHISPGGGFQGGVVLASFFICRYMIYAIYDIRIGRVIMLEKIIYIGIVVLAAVFIFLSAHSYLPISKDIYLVMMNIFIGMKVACGFLIIFYRFIAFEWR